MCGPVMASRPFHNEWAVYNSFRCELKELHAPIDHENTTRRRVTIFHENVKTFLSYVLLRGPTETRTLEASMGTP
jgi:hypothetical protein